ncbi:MAG: ATP-binding protein, partial [Novosphingobium sp.]
LRSALESLEKVNDPDLRSQLTAIATHDVRRIDRLVTEIADASRIDAELSRTAFAPVDLHKLVTQLAAARDMRGANRNCRIYVIHAPEDYFVSGDAPQLERVIENLLDNAVSFSPDHGKITVTLRASGDRIITAVKDEGPGIPPDAREKVFERFHSLRPASEDFGTHSGLGLAIARTIVEAHDGTLTAVDRPDGKAGACLVIDLPARSES